jgi:hypothetical protein
MFYWKVIGGVFSPKLELFLNKMNANVCAAEGGATSLAGF